MFPCLTIYVSGFLGYARAIFFARKLVYIPDSLCLYIFRFLICTNQCLKSYATLVVFRFAIAIAPFMTRAVSEP